MCIRDRDHLDEDSNDTCSLQTVKQRRDGKYLRGKRSVFPKDLFSGLAYER